MDLVYEKMKVENGTNQNDESSGILEDEGSKEETRKVEECADEESSYIKEEEIDVEEEEMMFAGDFCSTEIQESEGGEEEMSFLDDFQSPQMRPNKRLKRSHEITNNCSNAVSTEYLKTFPNMTLEEKIKIVENGRPTPELPELTQKVTQGIRKFSTLWYSKKDWLCGCIATKRLFCFPCMLFSNGKSSSWVKEGFYDLKNLPNAFKKHERSTVHYGSQIALRMFRRAAKTDLTLDKPISVSHHNQVVKENREILEKLICTTCFLIKQEVIFHEGDEKKSINRGNHDEVLNYIAKFDEKFARYLQNSSVFSGLSATMQDELIEAITSVVDDNIKEEIEQAPFVAIEVDERADTSQFSTVLRYVVKSAIKEVFIGFDTLEDRTVKGVTNMIFNNLNKYDCLEKLVIQTYDGALIRASDLDEVLFKVKEMAPLASFFHSYVHKLNLVLSQSAKFIPECASFFKFSEALASFFSQSTKRSQHFEEIVNLRVQKTSPTKWNSNSKLIKTILQYHGDLCKLYNGINNSPMLWDSDTIVKSCGFYDWLTTDSTYFLLVVYDKIFIEINSLLNVLKAEGGDISYSSKRIIKAINSIEKLSGEFENLYEKFEKYCRENNLTESKSFSKHSLKEERMILFNVILDDVLKNVRARFNDFIKFKFISLLDCYKFPKTYNHYDKEAFGSLEMSYGKVFDAMRLKADLLGLYYAPVFRDKSVNELLDFIYENELEQTFAEVVKLMQLVLTIPATSIPGETSSALKRIKSYCSRTTSTKFSSLTLLCIEKERLNKMELDPSFKFYEKVMDAFATKKERRMDFAFK